MTALLLLSSLAFAAPAPAPVPPASTSTARGVATDERRRALLLTDLLIEEERLGEAEALAEQGFAVDSDTLPWTFRMARIRTAQGRYGEAADLYERILAGRSDDAGVLLDFGQLAHSAGEHARAKRAFLKVRELMAEPVAPYYLSEIAHSEGDEGESRRWAEVALGELKDPSEPGPRRMKLHLEAKLRWRDGLEDEFGRLFDSAPRDPDVAAEWASVLLARGYADAAAEPIALVRERSSKNPARWRLLEADRLRLGSDRRALRAHLEESAALWPAESSLRFALGELEVQDRRWPRAAAHLDEASRAREFAAPSRELLVEVRKQGRAQLGPAFRWRDSKSTKAVELGAAGSAYPRPGWRLEGSAERAQYSVKSRSERILLSGGLLTLAREAPGWRAGADLDARSGAGISAVSPGAFAEWEPTDFFSAELSGAVRRAWRDFVEAAAAGCTTQQGRLSLRTRPHRRLHLGAQAHVDRATPRAGGTGTQTVLTPEALWTVLERPFYAALAYRYVMVDASGDALFFSNLPLLRKARTHYAVLSAGRYWLESRLRADGYVYNGHEPERGRRFGAGDLAGLGANLEWIGSRVRLVASYELTQDQVSGVGGRSQSVKLTALRMF